MYIVYVFYYQSMYSSFFCVSEAYTNQCILRGSSSY